MPSVILVDTSIFLNVLDVVGFNQDREEVLDLLRNMIEDPSQNSLLLPYAVIVETGNHIAHVANGEERRRSADRFVAQIRAAFGGDAPWTPISVPGEASIKECLEEFTEYAMREIGFGDLSIIKDWEAACSRHPLHNVRIWSLDQHLAGYDR